MGTSVCPAPSGPTTTVTGAADTFPMGPGGWTAVLRGPSVGTRSARAAHPAWRCHGEQERAPCPAGGPVGRPRRCGRSAGHRAGRDPGGRLTRGAGHAHRVRDVRTGAAAGSDRTEPAYRRPPSDRCLDDAPLPGGCDPEGGGRRRADAHDAGHRSRGPAPAVESEAPASAKPAKPAKAAKPTKPAKGAKATKSTATRSKADRAAGSKKASGAKKAKKGKKK